MTTFVELEGLEVFPSEEDGLEVLFSVSTLFFSVLFWSVLEEGLDPFSFWDTSLAPVALCGLSGSPFFCIDPLAALEGLDEDCSADIGLELSPVFSIFFWPLLGRSFSSVT